MNPPYDPDWHHTDDAIEILHAIGLLSIEWSMTEHYMSMVISNFFPGTTKSASVAMNLGNNSKTDALLKFSKHRRFPKAGIESIEFCAKCFDRIRENRNIILHTHSIRPMPDGKFSLVRGNANAPTFHVRSVVSIDDIHSTISITMILGHFLSQLWLKTSPARHIKKTGVPWPNIFPIPDKFATLPLEDQQT